MEPLPISVSSSSIQRPVTLTSSRRPWQRHTGEPPSAGTRTACCTLLGVLLHAERRQASRRRLARLAEASAEDAAPSEELLRRMQLAKVPKHLWPLLMTAAEGAGGNTLASITSAAQGVATWRERLAKGRVWREEEGANWPDDSYVRQGWQDLLREKGLPQLVKRYPKLLDPLMASLLETVDQFQQELQESDENGDGENEDEAEGEADEGEASQQSSAEDSAASNDASDALRAQLAEKLMGQLSEELGQFADAVKATDNAFGTGAGEAMVEDMEGFGAGQGQWHESLSPQASAELLALAQIMRSSPELRELLRNLGRRSAVRGPMHKLPEEIWHASGPEGVIRSPAAPAEATGVTLSGNWDTMLPSEAQLLAANNPMLRTLHHARRIEQSLLCYDRSSWLRDESRNTGRYEIRPRGKAGPLILCLDTSGSMMGDREVLSKALVVECVRQAHRQGRPCYLYAFAGAGDLKELELDLSRDGLRKVLDFLKQSFGGGTYLEDALSEAAQKLEQDAWRNADLLIVTDGELNANTDEASITKARAECGTKVTGLVLADHGGAAMERLCDELYLTGNASRFRGEKGLKFPKLKKLEMSTA